MTDMATLLDLTWAIQNLMYLIFSHYDMGGEELFETGAVTLINSFNSMLPLKAADFAQLQYLSKLS